MNKTNLIKKLAALTLMVTGALTLAACSDKSLSTPYGSIKDTVYLSGNGYSITEKELYEEMRLSSSSILIEMIEKELYKDELATINSNLETYKADLVEYANEAIFGITDLDALKELTEATITQKVLSFIDSFYLVNIDITSADIDTVDFENHNDKILDYYKLTLAKKMYAKTILDKEVIDKASSSYIDKDTALQTYFAANIQNSYDMSAITIRFANLNEANATLRHFNLKALRGLWYELPDPRKDILDANNDKHKYALEVLNDLGLANEGKLSDKDYQNYYNAYSINDSRVPLTTADIALTEDETLQKFIEIYNYIYSYRAPVSTSYTVETLLADLDNVSVFTKTYKEYSNSSLRSYVYQTLSTEEGETRFTSSPRQTNNYYHLAFKLKGHNEEILNWVDEDDKFIVYKEDGELTDKALELYDLVFDSKLTKTYISAKANERLNDTEVVIYDELVKLYVSQGLDSVKLASKSSKDIIAKFGDKSIKVDEFFVELEKKLGVSVAIDMAIKETLKASEYTDTITAEKRAEFKTNIENIIKQFGQGYYENSGYPVEIGRKNFLMLAFRAENIDQAVENVFVSSALEEAYLADLEAHFGEDVYTKLVNYAAKLQQQYFSLSASHLLIFVDMDEDDNPDKPEAFLETLSVEKQTEVKALVTELMQTIHDRATTYSSFSTGLTAIVDEFKTAGRITPDSCSVAPLDVTPECRWAKYKAAGLNIMFESLPAINNTTNTIGSSSALDDAFYERAMGLFTRVKEEFYDVDSKFPSQELDVRPSSYDSMLESSFGWHLILATGGSVSSSAKFGTTDDTKKNDSDEYYIYERIEFEDEDGEKYYLSAYSDTDAVTAEQARIYINEVGDEYGVQNLPSKVKTAVNAYFAPVFEKYNSQNNQLNLLYKLLGDTNFNFANADNNAKAQKLMKINQDQFFSYNFTNESFNEVYGDWWTIFE
ncbi:MAG: hypothetical protein RBQ91_03305 [Acholeplasma sp.]|nr:hypothetical protein [Acholeplasma sp.]